VNRVEPGGMDGWSTSAGRRAGRCLIAEWSDPAGDLSPNHGSAVAHDMSLYPLSAGSDRDGLVRSD